MRAKEGHHVAGYTTWSVLSTWDNYSPANTVTDMDKNGIAAATISLVNPGSWFGDPQETRKLVRELNEFGAKMVSDYPGRFGLMAVCHFRRLTIVCTKSSTHSTRSSRRSGTTVELR